jgi:hypothetical protein
VAPWARSMLRQRQLLAALLASTVGGDMLSKLLEQRKIKSDFEERL